MFKADRYHKAGVDTASIILHPCIGCYKATYLGQPWLDTTKGTSIYCYQWQLENVLASENIDFLTRI